jgi:hypothetical protein
MAPRPDGDRVRSGARLLLIRPSGDGMFASRERRPALSHTKASTEPHSWIVVTSFG